MSDDVYLDELTTFSYKSDPVQLGCFGLTSSGKSYCALILMNQWQNGIFFDPQSRAKDILEEQGIEHEWRVLKVQYKKKRDSFLINAEDLNRRIVNSLSRTMSPRDQKMRIAFNKFFLLSRQKRTYSTLEEIFHNHKLISEFDEFSLILHPNDNAKPLKIYNEGKTLIDVSETSEQSHTVGLIIESVVGWKKEAVFENTPFFFALDEAQKFARTNTLCGISLAACATRTRVYGISTIVMGTNYTQVENTIRKNLKIFLLFKNSFDVKHFNKEFGLEVSPESISLIPFGQSKDLKGWCLYFNKNEDKVEGDLIRPNLFWKISNYSVPLRNEFYIPKTIDAFPQH